MIEKKQLKPWSNFWRASKGHVIVLDDSRSLDSSSYYLYKVQVPYNVWSKIYHIKWSRVADA